MIVRGIAYPRGGLIGNPSDGYFGKTMAMTFRNFRAEVTLWESPELEILPNTRDHSRFADVEALAEDVRRLGYYGGIRLLKATVKRFLDYCREAGVQLAPRNFTLRYNSDIPHLVGLAGSSAIITACMRALKQFYGVSISPEREANLVLSVETGELGISAGLQDRVAQVFEGLVYMDFSREYMEREGCGRYRRIDPAGLPPLYIAYRADLSEGSEIVHGNLRARFTRGEPEVLESVRRWAELTDKVCALVEAGEGSRIGPLLDENFDRRAALYDVGEGNRRMVAAARRVGASAKFTGSGGAIIGTYRDAAMFDRLCEELRPLNVCVLKPELALPEVS